MVSIKTSAYHMHYLPIIKFLKDNGINEEVTSDYVLKKSIQSSTNNTIGFIKDSQEILSFLCHELVKALI